MVKRYYEFIKEDESVSKDSSKYMDVIDDIKSMIESTIEKSGGEFDSFVDSYIKNPEDVKIEKFINDSDIYDFYLKFRNDIDEILNDIKFFSESPSDNNSFGLYEYTIKGTEKAFLEFIKMIK
jgi:hypothetical protein